MNFDLPSLIIVFVFGIFFGSIGIGYIFMMVVRKEEKRTRQHGMVLWLPVFKNGHTVPGQITRPIVDYGIPDRSAVSGLWKNPDRLLRLELDRETLDVISARTEKP